MLNADPSIVVEWNCGTAGSARTAGGDFRKEELVSLARALGRLAARRDLALAHEDRAPMVTNSNEMPGSLPANSLN